MSTMSDLVFIPEENTHQINVGNLKSWHDSEKYATIGSKHSFILSPTVKAFIKKNVTDRIGWRIVSLRDKVVYTIQKSKFKFMNPITDSYPYKYLIEIFIAQVGKCEDFLENKSSGHK